MFAEVRPKVCRLLQMLLLLHPQWQTNESVKLVFA